MWYFVTTFTNPNKVSCKTQCSRIEAKISMYKMIIAFQIKELTGYNCLFALLVYHSLQNQLAWQMPFSKMTALFFTLHQL